MVLTNWEKTMARGMRRAIKVFGAVLNTGVTINTDSDQIVSVTIHPDKSVTYLDPAGNTLTADGQWVSYVPRFN